MVPEEERAHGTIANKTYFTYVREGGNTILVLFLIAVFFISQVLITIPCSACVYVCACMSHKLIYCPIVHRVVLLQLPGGCQDGKKKCIFCLH